MVGIRVGMWALVGFVVVCCLGMGTGMERGREGGRWGIN